MKTFLKIRFAAFSLVAAFFLLLSACQKEEATTPETLAPPVEEQALQIPFEGKYKKTLPIADASGENRIVLEVSSDNEDVLDYFDDSTFFLEPFRELPWETGIAATASQPADAQLAEEDMNEKETDFEGQTVENTYYVKVSSKSLANEFKGVMLKVRGAASSATTSRVPCPILFGVFYNTTNGLGVGHVGTPNTVRQVRFLRFQWPFNWVLTYGPRSLRSYPHYGISSNYTQEGPNNSSCSLRTYRGQGGLPTYYVFWSIYSWMDVGVTVSPAAPCDLVGQHFTFN